MEFLTSLDFSPVWQYRWPLFWGLVETLWMAALAFAIAVPAGLGLALGRIYGGWLVNLPIMAFVDLMRFTPLLVQAVWIHFALPAVTGMNFAATQSAMIALSLHVTAYVCDVMRAGIIAIPKGQGEAARALGMKRRAVFFHVTMPQVWPLVLPPLGNVAVASFKLTTILGILAVDDLMKVTNRISTLTFRTFEFYTTAAVIYLLVGLLLTFAVHRVERRFGASRLERSAARADRASLAAARGAVAAGPRTVEPPPDR
ncbi:amino acid ABC transporter permease [Histidinibacterium lentulum]|uniref:Amino acid ABC transporter permease n=1 Tax=Histidinibacterium lentulum TaxID=2480588 RepID=A0A3N2QR51_9RHOB|nr:amino acid ABC transporter permease [Histidinibacterium lentulum]ROT97686.1 amino acid ABC transporter permease [Histidinibacterium lentulum]